MNGPGIIAAISLCVFRITSIAGFGKARAPSDGKLSEIIALLAADLAALRMQRALVTPMRKYRANQPRVPVGNSDGGQWTDAGSSVRLAGGAEDDEPNRAGRSVIIENPMADLRREAFAGDIAALRRLDPTNPQLSYIASPEFVPRQDQIDALRNEVETARSAVTTPWT